jgi:hypothetical protein
VPDWDSTERRDSDEDATWRDLVARFGAPSEGDEPTPWPDREDPDRDKSDADDDTDDAGAADQAPVSLFQTETSTTGVPAVSSWRASAPPRNPDDEHFVPPTPPPLPRLEPLTKAAWAGLFGGPGYLLVATAAHWSIPGIAVFCAIAAFVGGVALLVLRMNDSDPPSAGDDDDGAVV